MRSTIMDRFDHLANLMDHLANLKQEMDALDSELDETSDLPTRDEFLAAHLTSKPDLEGTLECPVCMKAFEKPVQTPCSHTFCAFCLTKWLRDHTSCPIDRQELYTTLKHCDDDISISSSSSSSDIYILFSEISMEPFSDRTDFAFHFHNEDVLDCTHAFDHWLSRPDQNYDDILLKTQGVEIDVQRLRLMMLGAIYRLASNSTREPNVVWREMIHGMCRREWVEVAHCIDRFLGGLETTGMTKRELEKRLRSRLGGFPRFITRSGQRDWAVRMFGEDDEEIVRFQTDLKVLARWIVWQAIRVFQESHMDEMLRAVESNLLLRRNRSLDEGEGDFFGMLGLV